MGNNRIGMELRMSRIEMLKHDHAHRYVVIDEKDRVVSEPMSKACAEMALISLRQIGVQMKAFNHLFDHIFGTTKESQ